MSKRLLLTLCIIVTLHFILSVFVIAMHVSERGLIQDPLQPMLLVVLLPLQSIWPNGVARIGEILFITVNTIIYVVATYVCFCAFHKINKTTK